MEDGHSKSVEEVLSHFRVDQERGLSLDQVKEYQKKYGPNGKYRRTDFRFLFKFRKFASYQHSTVSSRPLIVVTHHHCRHLTPCARTTWSRSGLEQESFGGAAICVIRSRFRSGRAVSGVGLQTGFQHYHLFLC